MTRQAEELMRTINLRISKSKKRCCSICKRHEFLNNVNTHICHARTHEECEKLKNQLIKPVDLIVLKSNICDHFRCIRKSKTLKKSKAKVCKKTK